MAENLERVTDMRRKRLKLAVVDGKTYVEVQSLLTALRERGLRLEANEIEIAVLRQKASQGIQPIGNGKFTYPGRELDLAVAS